MFGSDVPQPVPRACWSLYFVLAGLLAFAGAALLAGAALAGADAHAVDAAAIALLIYASGGVSSNLGILLVIPVGSMALLAVGREALVIAAMAALAILAQQIASQLDGFSAIGDYPLAGVMGAIIFLVAASAWPVANRLRESEAQVRRQEVDLANLAQLSQYIVQRLRESILVVDPTDRIRLINESAAEMLGDAVAVPGALLGRSVAAPAVPADDVAQHGRGTPGRGAARHLCGRRRRAHHRAAFRAARRGRTRAGADLPRGHQRARRARAAIEARGAGPAHRQHRARDPQPGRRDEPRRAAARRIAAALAPRTCA